MKISNERTLPDNDLTLKNSRDFIMNSLLARRALTSKCLAGELSILLNDLIEKIYRLSLSCHMPEFTDHGLSHISSLVERVSSWTVANGQRLVEFLNSDDAARLLVAILIHDLGMLSQRAEHLPADIAPEKQKALNPKISNWVRKTHIDRLVLLFKDLVKELKSDFKYTFRVDDTFIKDTLKIACSHDKWAWEFEFKKDNLSFLAAVLAVVDLLDEDSARCDTMTMIKHRHGDELNKAHWIRHCLTANRVSIEMSRIKVLLVKPANWSNDSLLEPLYSAIRNHFKLIKLYNGTLKYGTLDAAIEIDFSPSTGVPSKVANELKCWNEIDGYGTEQAFCYQLLNSFMNIALKEDMKEDELKHIKRISMEDIELTEFKRIRSESIPRSEYEKSFYALLGEAR